MDIIIRLYIMWGIKTTQSNRIIVMIFVDKAQNFRYYYFINAT